MSSSVLTPLRQLVEELDRRGDVVVIEAPSGDVTAVELARLARFWSSRFLDAGLLPGDTALLSMRDRVGVCAALLACQMQGIVFAPVDPDVPEARLKQLADAAQANAIVTDDDRTDSCCSVVSRSAGLALITPTASVKASVERARSDRDLDASYIYFTSGSSGAPRPVLGRQSSLEQFIDWEIREFEVVSTDRCTQLIRPWFDAFLRDVLVPLAAGAVLILPPHDPYGVDAEALAAWVSSSNATFGHCGPTLLRRLSAGAAATQSLVSMRQLLVSGEPLLGQDVSDWVEAGGCASALVNFYGTTETTMIKMAHRVRADDANRLRVPVGRPMEGCTVMVVDEAMEPLEDGVSGEVVFVGSYFSAGYLGGPEVFLVDPANPANVRYRTGDIGRIMADGSMELLGRRDAQLKIHGVRVEPLEVETALRSIQGVNDAVVGAVEIGDDRQLGALVASSEHDTPAIRALLAQRLPIELVPTRICTTRDLPLTQSGKVDRRAAMSTIAEDSCEPVIGAESVPLTEWESVVLEIFSGVLNDDSLGAEHDFFASGGDSLTAMQVVARLRRDAGLEIQIRDLFERPTARSLAGLGDRSESMPSVTDVDAVLVTEVLTPLQPLSETQRRIWFVEQLGAGSAYRVSAAVRLKGPVCRDGFERATAAMLAHRELWRGRFVLDSADVPWFEVPQDHVVDEPVEFAQAISVDAALHHETLRPIDLGNGPLMRATLYSLPDDSSLFVLSTHHIVADEASMRSAMLELARNYALTVLGEVLAPTEVDRGYAGFVHGEQKWLRETAGEAAEYWKHKLAGVQPIQFPIPSPAAAAPRADAPEVFFALDPDLTSRVDSIADSSGSTSFVTLAGAVALALGKLTGRTDITVSTSVDLRDRSELLTAVGVFVNTVVLRLPVEPGSTLDRTASAVREAWLDAHPYRYYPFDRLHSMNQQVTSVNVDYHAELDFDSTVLDPDAGTVAERVDPPHLESKFPIDISFERTSDGITASARYQPSVVDIDFVERLIETIKQCLADTTTDDIDLTARQQRANAFFG